MEEKIPQEFIGTYHSKITGSIIYIEDSVIYRNTTNFFGRGIATLFSEMACDDDENLDFLGHACSSIGSTDQETTTADLHTRDTIFSLCAGGLIKASGNNLFLNYLDGYGDYFATILTRVDQDIVTWSLIELPEDEAKLRAFTSNISVHNDRCKHNVYVLTPTSQQFENVLTSKFLVTQDTLTLSRKPIGLM